MTMMSSFLTAVALLILPGIAIAAPSKQGELNFSQKQIVQYEALLGQLAERAEVETDEANRAHFKAALTNLEQKIDLAKESRENLQDAKSKNAILLNQEDLKNDLFAMQDSAREAVGIFVDADNRQGRGPLNRTRPLTSSSGGFKISAASAPGSGLNP